MREDEEQELKATEITEIIIGAAIEVHRLLGPGLLESEMKWVSAVPIVRVSGVRDMCYTRKGHADSLF